MTASSPRKYDRDTIEHLKARASAAAGQIMELVTANAAAVLERNRLLQGGLKDVGTTALYDGREDFARFWDDVNQMVKAASAPDFLQLQSQMAQRTASRSSERMLRRNSAFTISPGMPLRQFRTGSRPAFKWRAPSPDFCLILAVTMFRILSNGPPRGFQRARPCPTARTVIACSTAGTVLTNGSSGGAQCIDGIYV